MRIKFGTGITTEPRHFQTAKTKKHYQRLVAGTNYHRFNKVLDEMEHKASTTFYALCDTLKRSPTTQEYRDAMDDTKSNEASFYRFAKDYAMSIKGKVNPATGRKFARTVHNQYDRTVELIREYNPRITFEQIDNKFYDGFVAWLTEAKEYSPSTISKRIAQIKTIMKATQLEGLHDNNKYTTFKRIAGGGDKIYLDVQELKEWYDLPLLGIMDRIRDLFLVGCWTGLRYSDYSKISKSDVRDGLLYIETSKTGTPVVVPLHPHVLAIFKKYEYKLPTYANQVMNRYLKEIAALVPLLQKEVTYRYTKGGKRHSEARYKYELVQTHTARRSFATNALLAGVPEKAVMDIGGWKDPNTLRNYIRFTPRQSTDIVQAYFEKAVR